MSTLKKIIVLLKEKNILIIISLILAFVSVMLSLYVNVVIGKAVDCMIGPGNVNFEGVKKCAITIGVSIGISAVFNYFMNFLLNKTAFFAVKKLREMLFEKLQRVPVSYIDKNSPGDMISRLVNDIEQVSDGLILSFAQLFSGVVTILGTLVFMFMLNFQITLIVLIATPITLVVARFIANNTYKFFVAQQSENGELSSITDESISGIEVVKAFGKEQETIEKFAETNEKLTRSSIKAVFYSSTVNPTTRIINGTIYAVVGICGAITVINNPGGAFTIGVLSSFLAYATQFSKPFNEISGVLAEFQGAISGAARVFEVLETCDETENDNAVSEFDSEGNLLIDNVSFSYVPEKPLIRDFNLNVKKGMRVAIVGPTGCGKTTFINLLMRFYDVDSGNIFLDGTKTTEIERDALRENFGMVLQETWLRNGTVRENIAMTAPDVSFDEIVAAAKAVRADGFIRRLENGYDTVISNDGAKLSHGQKQLICIARIMLMKPPMLILDEATSSIDTRTEIKVQQSFAKLMEGRTSFIVAHRLSTIKNCDIIVVMKDGRIIEQGTHDELLEVRGFYYELWNTAVN